MTNMYFEVVDIVDQEDGSAIATIDLSYDFLLFLAEKGLNQILREAAYEVAELDEEG